ncbi:MAG: hypothetical protein ACRDT1_15425, partial [Micromonosporaceae bacterium]
MLDGSRSARVAPPVHPRLNPAALLAISVLLLQAGCGGDDGKEIIRAAESAVLPSTTAQLAGSITPPSYLQVDIGRSSLRTVRITREGDEAATVRAQTQTAVRVSPKLDKAPYLRVVPSDGGTMMFTTVARVPVYKSGDGDWIAESERLKLEGPAVPESSPTEQEQARKLAIEAVRALLT